MTAITAWHGTTQVHHTEIVPVQLMDQTWNLHGIPPLTTCHQHSVVQNKTDSVYHDRKPSDGKKTSGFQQ